MRYYQTFVSEHRAQLELDKLIGWPDARLMQLYLPDDQMADENGNVWVIEAAPEKYLLADGYID